MYSNPSCSKSRGTLDILRERGVEFDTIEYLLDPPDRAALERILDLLPGPPSDLVRNDDRFKELGLRRDDYIERDVVIELLLEHPELMERPVVIAGDRAIIARPPELVLDLI